MKTNKEEELQLDRVFCGNSRMAEAMRHHDWNTSDLGPVATWPESLKMSVRLILASAYPMFVWWGPEMIMFYNDGYIPVLGVKHPQALGKPGKEMWSEVWDKIGPLMEEVLHKGKTHSEEKSLFYTQRLHFKEETYYTYSYSPIIEANGSISGIFCACYEDTPQVLSVRRLSTISRVSGINSDSTVEEVKQQVLDILKDNSNDLPFVLLYTLNEGKINLESYTRDAFTTSLEKEPGLLLGQSFPFDCIGDTITEPFSIPEELKSKLKIPAHGVLPKEAVIIPVTDAGQQLVRGYLVAGLSPALPYNNDYQEFISLLSSQINATVTQNRAFERERLISKKLIDLDKAKTDFFSNVSHEFRTPLTLILGPLEGLLNRSDSFSEEDKTNLKVLQRNAMRLLKQVNNLLSFANVEAGRQNARFVQTELAHTTYDLASTFRTVMEQGGLTYTINCSPLQDAVYVDQEMWEIIVLNLLSNAFKYTLSGSIAVELRELNNAVELEVRDTGVGILESEVPKLFDKFHRIEQTEGRTFEGSGIGLPLVWELVRLHGGDISVTSEVGKGSKFTVILPKGKNHLPPDRIRYVSNSSAQTGSATLYCSEAETWAVTNSTDHQLQGEEDAIPENTVQDERRPAILVVDDNPDMLHYVKRLLETEFYVLTAENGQVALNILKVQTPSLILSDIMMPVMDGVTMLHKIRKTPAIASIPVILLSARAGTDDKFAGLNTGADDYLVKPFSEKELVTRIRSCINNAKLREELKQVEHQLLNETAQQKELLETILNSISDGFLYMTFNLEFNYVNNRVLEISGKPKEAFKETHLLDVFPELKGTWAYNELVTAATSQKQTAFEFYDPLAANWYDVRIYPTNCGVSVYLADITARKTQEIAQQEIEQRFKDMINIAPVLIWMSGPDKNCNFFNDHWLEFRGRTLQQECGSGWLEGVHPEDAEYYLNTYYTSFDKRKAFSMEYRLLNRRGEYRWVLDNGTPRLCEDGQLLGYVGACTDITEQKWAESLLHNYNSELEARVEERTAALQIANEQLKIEIREKNRKKMELVRSHEQLHSLTSHLQDLRENERKLIAREIHDEFGQALTALKIEIMLLHDRIAESRSKYKSSMLETLASMDHALDASLLSLRKIISHLRPSLSDDLELVYEIKRLVADLQKRVGIQIVVKSGVKKIELAPNVAIEVYRVMQESVTNIIKHARASAASIEISKENNKFRLLVKDNGIGFDQKMLTGGHSFGILGIKERAQRIGADLIIESGEGKGTTVELLVDATLSKTNYS